MTGAGRFATGLVVGLLAVLLIGVLASRGDDMDAATTISTTVPETSAAPADPWIEEGEVMIGATAILPRSLNVDGDRVYFDYDLAGLSPYLGEGEESTEQDTRYGDFMAMPERWLLTTENGAQIESTTGPFDTSVSFELPEGDAARSIALVGWRVAVPFGDRIELDIAAGETGEIRRGTVNIETVLEQTVSTIVQIDFDGNGDSWDASVALRPIDTRWRVSGRQGGGLQLIWEGDNAPDTVVIEDAGFEMRPVAGEVTVVAEIDSGGDARGDTG